MTKQIIYKWQHAGSNMNLDSAVEQFRPNPHCPTLAVYYINPKF